MEWKEVNALHSESYIPVENFWSSLKVWIERPHVINTKILITEIIESGTIQEKGNMFKTLCEGQFDVKDIEMMLGTEMPKNSSKQNLFTDDKTCIESTMNFEENMVFLRSSHPRHFKKFNAVLDVVVLDYTERSVQFFPRKMDVVESPTIPPFPYKLKLDKNRIVLEVIPSEIKTEAVSWLTSKVLPKIFKWSQKIPTTPVLPSLQLISAKDYNANLFDLKSKYAQKYLEIWSNYNNTDPKKYVYEDIAIAAYLITFWTEERRKLNLKKKQTYVDLGCGNGFLDHILSSEGYEGIGIDLRRRKIWTVYGPDTNLVEKIIRPSDELLFPNYDWIIGNHADELTPWIPVIAARSSYNMKVFLLPCCFYTFDGKYARPCPKMTQYQSYLEFLKNLCKAMGFKAHLDKLRIPSTKRTCLVCTSRTYEEKDQHEIDFLRDEFIQLHSTRSTVNKEMKTLNTHHNASKSLNWNANFSPRDSVEKVQNCTNINKFVVEKIIKCIFYQLLSTESFITVTKGNSTFLWNKGGFLKFSCLSKILGSEMLSNLKAHNGGLRTLLRNHGHLFNVQNDKAELRVPTKVAPMNKVSGLHQKQHTGKLYKKKKCFLHLFHPQGCPSSEEECNFHHTAN